MLFRRQGLLWLCSAAHILRLYFVKNLSLLFFSSFAFCHLQDWMVSLWMHTEYWVGMVGLSDHLTCQKPNCIVSVQLYFEHISHSSNNFKVK